jgi:hypothetical protein
MNGRKDASRRVATAADDKGRDGWRPSTGGGGSENLPETHPELLLPSVGRAHAGSPARDGCLTVHQTPRHPMQGAGAADPSFPPGRRQIGGSRSKFSGLGVRDGDDWARRGTGRVVPPWLGGGGGVGTGNSPGPNPGGEAPSEPHSWGTHPDRDCCNSRVFLCFANFAQTKK